MKNSQRIENLQSYLFDLKRNKKKIEEKLNRLADHYIETKNQIKEVKFKLSELVEDRFIVGLMQFDPAPVPELWKGVWKEEAPIDKENNRCTRNIAEEWTPPHRRSEELELADRRANRTENKWVPPFRPADHTERKFNDGILQHLPKEKIVIPKAEINLFLARHNKTQIQKK